MDMSQYLQNFPKLKTNYARSAQKAEQDKNGYFSGITSSILGWKADKIDAQNQKALQDWQLQNQQAQQQAQWNREDAVALRNRGWAQEDAKTARQNALADTLTKWDREDAIYKRERKDKLSDYLRNYKQENNLTPFEKAYQAEKGQERAKRENEFENQTQQFQRAKGLVDELSSLAEEATYSPLGRAIDNVASWFGADTEGGLAREKYKQMVNNEMIPQLKTMLGGSFTEKEAERLTKTLGDLNSTPAEKKAALESFLSSKQRTLQEAKNKLFPQEQAEYFNPYPADNPLGL